MSTQDLTALLPMIIIAAGSVTLMMSIAVKRHHGASLVITLLTLAGAFVSLFATGNMGTHPVAPMLVIDSFGLFYSGLIFFSSTVIAFLAYVYLKDQEEVKEEFYILLLLGTLGASVLTFSNHFIAFFLGLELLSVSLYVMIAYLRHKRPALEAGLKYLILAAASSAFLLLGMALVYAETGIMTFSDYRLTEVLPVGNLLLMSGIGLLLAGFGFKLALVPFHLWTPDVYEGANAPVTAFIATVSKGAVVAVFLRFFMLLDSYNYPDIILALSIIAIASMFVGNLLALLQNNVKRILAYSSIAHLGYLMVALIAGGRYGAEAVTFYIVAYVITILGAFSIVSLLSSKDHEAMALDDYQGLFWRRPWLATVFTITLLSLAGIPLTAGFIGKYYVLIAGVSYEFWVLVFALVISSVIGLFYYLRIIRTMLSPLPESAAKPPLFIRLSAGSAAVLAVIGLLLLWIGVFPTTLMGIIEGLFR